MKNIRNQGDHLKTTHLFYTFSLLQKAYLPVLQQDMLFIHKDYTFAIPIKFAHKDEACFTPNNFSFAVFFALVTR